MGIKDVRDAFTAASNGATCTQARLRYAHGTDIGPNAQVLEFDGQHADGTPFHIVTDPFIGDPNAKARETAISLLTHKDA